MSRKSAELPSDCSPPNKLQEERVHNETHLENDKLPSSSYFTSDISIPKLPVEVMTHVFRFMSLRERLNASLVCREWNEAASHPSYSRNEKLVFRGYQDCEELLKFLLKTERKILHLEFHSCNLSGSNLLLVADKIHYLGFYECQLGSTLQIELFTKCVNLKELYVKDKRTYTKSMANLLPYFNREIVNLLDQKHFINDNLKALSLDSLQTNLTAHNILSIFKMFPNIRHLSFRPMKMYWNSDNLSSNRGSIAILIQEIVSLKHTLEDLKTIASGPQLRSLVLHDFTRLKRISLWCPTYTPEKLIFDFFSRLKCVERISFSSIFESSFHTRFIEHLINQCSNLKHLKLKLPFSCHIDLGPEMFRALLSSKLTSLKINGNIRPASDELFTTSTNFPANNTLRVLRISTLINHRMQCLFIQSFTNLRVLHLECFSGAVLESIGQFQKRLTTLNLNMVSCRSPRNERLTGTASIWRSDQVYNCLQSLACLENLYLNFPCSALFNCEFIPSTVKYLHIIFSDLDSTFDSEAFKHLIHFLILALKEKTELEGIYFAAEDDCKTDLSIWSEVCSSLNKLRFLSLHGRTTKLRGPFKTKPDLFEETPEALRVYECCPSLRCFTRTSNNYHGLLHYDYVDRKMKNVKYQSKMFDYLTVDKAFDSKIKFPLMGDAILLPYY